MRRAPLCLAALLLLCLAEPALAQAKNPFSVGISEGGGSATGVTGWLLAQQGWFEHRLTALVKAARADGSAAWTLVGLSLLYGIFHAAGPGHGKAVLASYMVANERALRRGILLSLLAALLQGLVAVTLIGVLALVVHATAQRMRDAAALVETASFAGIACLGAWLVWRKGRAFRASWRHAGPSRGTTLSAFSPYAGADRSGLAFASAAPAMRSRFVCTESDAPDASDCAHCLALDPSLLGGVSFSWREAGLTVLAAGLRPCSGAILVLVFALTQGLLTLGIAAVLAMSVGVAVTTATLASIAVLAKGAARWLARSHSHGGLLITAGLELLAASVVLLVGVSLLLGSTMTGGA